MTRNYSADALRAMLDICLTNPYTSLFPIMNIPNVHEYPEHANERELLAYKIAVEQAALDGKPIEISKANRNQWAEYGVHDVPAFCWNEWHYRVARPKVAEGHNPAGVTEDQIPGGWRLLSLEEAKSFMDAHPWCGYVSETRYRKNDGSWSDSFSWRVHSDDPTGTLITQKPAGFYLPQAKIAEGHNPDKLTEEQVETSKGYRLLTTQELSDPRQPGLQMWDRNDGCWTDAIVDWVGYGHFGVTTYRTKAAVGRYAPKPVRPTTVLGWLNLLPDGYRERALRGRLAVWDDEPAASTAGALLRALSWARSEEGDSFWAAVYTALTDLRPLPPLPDAPKKVVPWSLDNFVWPDCVRRRTAGGKVFGVQLADKTGLYVGLHTKDCETSEHSPIDWQELAEDFEYSVDNGRTWQPCCRTEDVS